MHMTVLLHILLCGLVSAASVSEIEDIDSEIERLGTTQLRDGKEDCPLPYNVTWCTGPSSDGTHIDHGESCVLLKEGLQTWIRCDDGTWSVEQQERGARQIRKKRNHQQSCGGWWWWRRCRRINHMPYFTRCTPPTTTFYVPGGSTSMNLHWQEPSAHDDEDGVLGVKRLRTQYVNGYVRVRRWWGSRRHKATYANYPHYGESFTGSKTGRSYPVSYVATDRNSQCAFCKFSVTVKISHCTVPSRPWHGSVSCPSGTKEGDVCTFSCNTGYRTSVSSTTCQSNGQWTHGSNTVCTAIVCSDVLPTFPNGRYQCSSYDYSKSCYPSCNAGYSLTSNYPITCRSTGWYRVDVSQCEDKQAPTFDDCPSDMSVTAEPQTTSAAVMWQKPTAVDIVDGSNVDIQLFGISPGTSQPVGTYTVEYQALDSAGNPGYCRFTVTVRVTRCPQMSTAHGSYTCSHDNLLGSECTWTCSSGFLLDGAAISICNSTGAWTNAAPTCTAVICPSPSDIGHTFAHGSYSCPSPIEFGDICLSTCDVGFGQSVASFAVCSVSTENQPAYDVNNVPVCKDTAPPVIANCDRPQVLNFTAERATTSAVVTWDTPVATDNVDPSPVVTQIPGGVSHGSSVAADDTAVVEWQATDSEGNPSDICMWILDVDVIKCPVYIPPSHGDLDCGEHNNIYGSLCSLTCRTGYEVSGLATSECLQTGEWSNDLACSVITCSGPPAPPDNGYYDCSDITYPYNSWCEPFCSSGFEIQNRHLSVCMGSFWKQDGTPICQDIEPPVIVDCQGEVTLPADIGTESAIVQVTPPSAEDNLDQDPTVTQISGPENGQTLQGIGIIQYQSVDSAGNPSSVCTTVVTVDVTECPVIGWPSFGSVYYSHNRVYGSTCTFSCNTGYVLSYDDTVTCGSDGSWSFVDGEAPVCQEIECAGLMVVENGNFSCPSLTYQSVCSLHCNTGFISSSVSYATCQSGGQWTYSSQESCEDAIPPVISNCKSYQTFYAEKGLQSAVVIWQIPTVTDNYDENVALRQIDGNPIGSRLTVGDYSVEYTATDETGNEALVTCSITVVVEEVVCAAPALTFSDNQLEFNCPSYAWGEACDVTCKNTTSKSYELSGSTTVTCELNPTETIPFWDDGDETSPVCDEIEEPSCALNLPYPSNGGLSYANTESMPVAFPFCDDTYDLPLGSDTTIFCLDTGTWRGTVQDCIPLLHPSLSVLHASFHYTGDCNSETNTNAIEDAVLVALEQYRGTTYAPDCFDDNSCDYDDFITVCGTSGVNVAKRATTTILITFRMTYNKPVESALDLSDSLNMLSGMASAINESIQAGHFNLLVNGVPLNVDLESFTKAKQMDMLCDAGQVLSGLSCKSCGRGAYLVTFGNGTSVCQPCPEGTYNNQEAATSCPACPIGYSTLTSGSKSLANCTEQCPASHFSATGFKPCTPCQKGYYQLNIGQTGCSKCPTGTTTFSIDSSCQAYDHVFGTGEHEMPGYSLPETMEAVSIAFWYLAEEGSSISVSLSTATSMTSMTAMSYFSLYLDTGSTVDTEIHVPITIGTWTHLVVVASPPLDMISVYKDGVLIQSPSVAFLDTAFPMGALLSLTINTIEDLRVTGIAVGQNDVNIEALSDTCQPSNTDTLLITDYFMSAFGVSTDTSTCLALDPCSEVPCGDGNQCTRTTAEGFTCTCLNGYSGTTCSVPPDYCASINCHNGGSCVSEPDGFICQCMEGYSGGYCDVSSDDGGWGPWSIWVPCTVTCGSGIMHRTRSCDSPVPSVFGADCDGDAAQHIVCNENPCPDASPCSVDPCGSEHQCRELSTGGFECNCLHGYTGTTCETAPGNCHDNNCRNSATCQEDLSASTGYTCLCTSKYTGTYCETILTITSFWAEWSTCSVSCNGGRSTRTRVCDPHVATDFCTDRENKICKSAPCPVDHCSSSPCGNHLCTSRGDTFLCTCDEGYTGTTCSEQLCSCVHGQCVATGDPQCLCDLGYEGALCEHSSVNGGWGIWEEWTQCSSTCGEGHHQRSRSCDNPSPSDGGMTCIGNAIETNTCSKTCPAVCQCGSLHDCVQVDGEFLCHCNHGFSGDQCQFPPDPCLPNPCLNDGTCGSNTETDFMCTCVGGYSGDICQIEPEDSAWSPWEAWGGCPVSCGGGNNQRTRVCEEGTETIPCEGESSETTPCNEEECPGCSELTKRYGLLMNCTVTGDLHTCELECEPGFKVANGSLFFTTYTCGPDTGYVWDQIVEVPSCSPVERPEKASGAVNARVSPPVPCNKASQVKSSVSTLITTTPCGRKSTCNVHVELTGCGASARKRSIEESSSLSYTISLNVTAGDSDAYEGAVFEEMDADVEETFETLTLNPDLSVDGVTYSVDMTNVTVDGVVECQTGSSLTEDGDCVGCAPGSYYDSTFGFCVYCSEGTYQELSGQIQCVACESGYYIHTTGSWQSSDCEEMPPPPEEPSESDDTLTVALAIAIPGAVVAIATIGVASFFIRKRLQRRQRISSATRKECARPRLYMVRDGSNISNFSTTTTLSSAGMGELTKNKRFTETSFTSQNMNRVF